MSGCFYGVTYVATAIGLFHDWKMSGVVYNDYADPRVGSPITTHYHWWDGSSGNWHGPVLRTGGYPSEFHTTHGQFISMHSEISVVHEVIGSRLSWFFTLTTCKIY